MGDAHNHTAVKSLKLAFFLNLGFTIVEFVGGIRTNGTAILCQARRGRLAALFCLAAVTGFGNIVVAGAAQAAPKSSSTIESILSQVNEAFLKGDATIAIRVLKAGLAQLENWRAENKLDMEGYSRGLQPETHIHLKLIVLFRELGDELQAEAQLQAARKAERDLAGREIFGTDAMLKHLTHKRSVERKRHPPRLEA